MSGSCRDSLAPVLHVSHEVFIAPKTIDLEQPTCAGGHSVSHSEVLGFEKPLFWSDLFSCCPPVPPFKFWTPISGVLYLAGHSLYPFPHTQDVDIRDRRRRELQLLEPPEPHELPVWSPSWWPVSSVSVQDCARGTASCVVFSCPLYSFDRAAVLHIWGRLWNSTFLEVRAVLDARWASCTPAAPPGPLLRSPPCPDAALS